MFFFILGYVLAVLFPIPWISSGIAALWDQVGTLVLNRLSQPSAPSTPPANKKL